MQNTAALLSAYVQWQVYVGIEYDSHDTVVSAHYALAPLI